MTTVRIPRPAILASLPLDRHLVIEASAGTGKTYTLEHLLVELVLVEGLSIDQILVVTFTEKAAREMRERVRATLRRALSAEADVPEGADAWSVDDEGRRRLSAALTAFDRAPISTIHAFCQRVLSENAFACRRLLEQRAVESRHVFAEALTEELRVALGPEDPLAPVVERALGRWGLEALEQSLFRWARESGEVRPRFQADKVARALRKLPSRLELAQGGFARRLLEDGLQRQPRTKVPARLLALAPAVERLREGAPLFEVLLAVWDWAAERATQRLDTLAYVRKHVGAGAERSPDLGPLAGFLDDVAQQAGSPLPVLVAELLPRVAARLAARKAGQGELDFDDMLRLLHEALQAPGGDALAEILRARLRVALVDEFQDTDVVQWGIVQRLFFDPGAAGHRLVVIGDPKQAIYGFRNADVHTYHAARRALLDAGGAQVPLAVSYRSTARVIDAVNRILADGFFTGVNAYPDPVRCGRPELRAVGADGRDAPAVTLLHVVGRGELRAADARRALAAAIAERARALLEGGLRVDRGDGLRPLEASDIHVLCRSRPEARMVAEAMAAADVPHAFYKQEGLFQTPAASDVWVLLRALVDLEDRSLRLGAWLTPFFAVPLGRLGDLRDLPPDHPLEERLRRWRALAVEQRWTELFRSLLEDSGFVRRELFGSPGERRLTDMQHILEVLLDEVHRGVRSLPQLTDRLQAFIEERERPVGESGNVHRLESERRAVQLLTMHKAKGLEAEVVFLFGGLSAPPPRALEPRIIHDSSGRRVAWIGGPDERVDVRARREESEEDQRLLYVALTRARSRLFLPYFGAPPPGAAAPEQAAFELIVDPREEPVPEGPQLRLLFAPDEPPPLDEDEAQSFEPYRFNGAYRVLNDRLVALVEAGALDGAGSLFDLETVEARRPERRTADQLRVRLAGWRPPAPTGAPGSLEARFAALREAHRGIEITSYTRMKRAAEEGIAGEARDAFRADTVDLAPAAEDLPGGAEVGVFLHELLEHVDLDAARVAEDADRLLAADRATAERLDAGARRLGLDDAQVRRVGELVLATLRTPLPLPTDDRLDGGLATVRHPIREMPFLQPIPETSHPPLEQAVFGERPLSIERGYLRGVVDLLFGHGGRTFVVDYKSDRLPSYEAGGLAEHVEASYRVQARLYVLGTLRALGIRGAEDYEARFGGLLYLFLRGLSADAVGRGVWGERPTWDEVRGWDEDLRRDDAPWGVPLPPRPGRPSG